MRMVHGAGSWVCFGGPFLQAALRSDLTWRRSLITGHISLAQTGAQRDRPPPPRSNSGRLAVHLIETREVSTGLPRPVARSGRCSRAPKGPPLIQHTPVAGVANVLPILTAQGQMERQLRLRGLPTNCGDDSPPPSGGLAARRGVSGSCGSSRPVGLRRALCLQSRSAEMAGAS